jgi:hypothetical protein
MPAEHGRASVADREEAPPHEALCHHFSVLPVEFLRPTIKAAQKVMPKNAMPYSRSGSSRL